MKKILSKLAVSFVSGILLLIMIVGIVPTECILTVRADVSETVTEDGDENPAVSGAEAEEAGDQTLTEDEACDFLFIGNSLTYFNNYPEMFRRIVAAGTGEKIRNVELYYPARTLQDHSAAIAAVLRTEGNSDNLTDEEKLLFCQRYSTVYEQEIYDRYAERIWDAKNHRARRYGTIVMQLHSRPTLPDGVAETAKQSVMNIIRDMDSPNTDYVVNGMMYGSSGPFRRFIDMQDEIDQTVSACVSAAKEYMAGKFSRVVSVPTGRAMCNYLLKYGTTYAQKIEPKAYYFYSKDNNKGNTNDLMYGDNVHPTQLGSYLVASTLYSVLYGDPRETVPAYRGYSKELISRVDGLRSPTSANFAYYYRNGKGLKSDELLLTAGKVAWETARKGLHVKKSSGGSFKLKDKKPALNKANKSDLGIQVTWNVLDGSEGYRIMRKTGSGKWKTIGKTRGISFFDSTAKWGHTYTYTVRSIKWEDNSAASSYNKTGLRCDYFRKPVLKSVKQVSKGVRFRWEASAGVKWYQIYRKVDSGKWTKLKKTDKTSFTDKTVKKGKKYTYSVRAMNKAKTRFVTDYDRKGLSIVVKR